MHGADVRINPYAVDMEKEIGHLGASCQRLWVRKRSAPPSGRMVQVGPMDAWPTGSGMTKTSWELSGLITVVIWVLPTGVSRKVGLGLIFLVGYWAVRYLSGRTERRSDTQPATGHNDSDLARPKAVRSSGGSGPAEYVNDEAIYARVYVDRNGDILNGSGHYQLAGDMDMQAVWWSVTIYNAEFDLVFHEEGRHSFTSFNTIPTEDGRRFVIDIAPDWPEGAVNWLPCRRGEPFNLVWRFYLPGTQVVEDPRIAAVPQIVSVMD
jgi:hypothetical protein